MNVRTTFAVAGFFLAALSLVLTAPSASAETATEDVTVSISLPPPDLDLNNLNFGDTYLAVNHPTASASATISPAIVLTHSIGTPGSARLIPIDTAAKNKLLVKITNGVPGGTMSLKIEDAATNAPFLTMTGVTTPADAAFKVDSWTFAVQPGGGTLTGFSGATGQGTITLNNTGAIEIWFGATLRTVPGPQQYSEQDYSGTLRITANY